MQGQKCEEWSRFEFPTLLDTGNTLKEKQLPSASSLIFVEDLSLWNFTSKLFVNFIQFLGDEEVPLSSKLKNNSERLTPSPVKLNVLLSRL